MSLGINKDLEPLVRKVRRAGGTVVITRRNHVLWTLPGGRLIRTGLTMSRTTSHQKRREIEKALLLAHLVLIGLRRRTPNQALSTRWPGRQGSGTDDRSQLMDGPKSLLLVRG